MKRNLLTRTPVIALAAALAADPSLASVLPETMAQSLQSAQDLFDQGKWQEAATAAAATAVAGSLGGTR